MSIWHDFRYHPKETIGGTQDWVYEHLGALFWVVEIWAPNREAGISELQVDRLVSRASGRGRPEAAALERRALRRPGARRLAAVRAPAARRRSRSAAGTSINFWRNPPPHLREREAARFPGWMTQIALSLPRLELLRTEVQALGPDTWRVRFAVANSGWLPAYISRRALARKVVRGVIFEIDWPEAARESRWSAASGASKGRSSRATRRSSRCRRLPAA